MGVRPRHLRSTSGLAATALLVGSVAGAVAATPAAPAAASAPSSCQLGNGVQHVINIVFDNVHFFRDNKFVPSDLEQMPHLLSFLESNGTVFSNSHTPLIAHTADDSLTIYTGLYGDRHGQPLTNTYNVYQPGGGTHTATSFTYWTSPIIDTGVSPAAPSAVDAAPSMTYSDTVPASGAPNRVTPAPWVPFTRAGCTVGDFSTANMVLENATVDVPTVFGAGSPEALETAANPDPFKDIQVAKYVGEAIHCAQGAAVCASSPRAVTDALPTEPGGYDGYQGLFGAQYVAPAIGGGPNVFHNGYRVTDANGNLVDLDGNTLQEPFSHTPGFPGFNPTASQSLAVLADMQEAGIPVTYGYISDTHDKKSGATGCTSPGNALGPGDACSVAALKSYDEAFEKWFERLAADGITPANTVFVIGAEENDQFAGANAVGRNTQPTPAGCDGVTVACHYTNTQVGELQANIKGLLSTTASATTQYDVQPQGASIYVHGQPAADDPAVRQLERDTAGMKSSLTYSGVPNEQIAKYQAGALEQRVLHMQTNDPLRTPTYSIFPMPDYFFSTSGTPNVLINNGFAYDHGYYSPNIDITWAGMAGPGVAVHGVDGPGPTGGNESQDPNSTHTVPEASAQGTWVEEADLRPTLLHLVGLQDDYQTDGQVITQALTHPNSALAQVAELGELYQQVNSSVGAFATDTLIADSKALASGSASDDSRYADEQDTLAELAAHRDRVATLMKATLARAAMGIVPGHGEMQSEMAQARALLKQAAQLAAHT
ncbi:MAG TPA: hypothetical protein VFV89_17410 [Nocardioides sp.]|uniref:hypothetical protein n=1 Tax=Nocardioides sp. TaxID=35761 RepID=UPI002E3114F7|nr:hypothetical protein [Nocardioides sp.]HEX5089589.1 hypothetical protein [Nocardioides sp.]